MKRKEKITSIFLLHLFYCSSLSACLQMNSLIVGVISRVDSCACSVRPKRSSSLGGTSQRIHYSF